MHFLDFYKIVFLLIGNISQWIYYGGKKSIDEISKEDHFTLGMIVSIVLTIIGFAIYNQS